MAREPESYISEDLFEAGIGHVIVCRFKGDGRVEAGTFLLDVFCLGVKDAIFDVYPNENVFREELLGASMATATARPGAWGRKLVEDAVNYALSLGISPNANYKKGARVFGGINAGDCEEKFVFGKNGRPLLIQGPDVDERTFDRIRATLRARLGEAGFDVLAAQDGERRSGLVLAVDSRAAEGDEPLAELRTLAEEFLENNSDLFDEVVNGGAPDHSIAAAFLESAREMQQGTASDGDASLSLQDALDYLQMVWNLANLDEEERAVALEQVPEQLRPALIFEAESLPPRETPFVILELRLLHSEDPERERLLMLLEPLP